MKWKLAGTVAGAAVVGVAGLTMVQAQAASPAYSSSLARAPYVTDMAQTTAEVNWGTTISSAAGSVQWVDAGSSNCATVSWTTWSSTKSHASASTQVPYGASGTIGWGYSVGTTKEYQNSAKATGLVAGHTYCYAVYTGKTSGTDLLSVPAYQSFTTLSTPSPSSTSTINFDVIGDTGENFANSGTTSGYVPFVGSPTSNPYESKLYSEIGSDGSQFLLGAGDTSYNGGTQDTFGDLTHTGTAAQATGTGGTEYSNIFGPSYLPLANGIPTYLADGNHGQNNYSLRFFPSQATAAASGGAYDMSTPISENGSASESLPEDWYAFSEGNVRIYVLDAAWPDSDVTPTTTMYQDDDAAHWQQSSPEMSWLTKDLAAPANAGMIKFAVFHFPLQSDTTTENTDTFLDQDLEPTLAKYGVAMAFNGHAHTYQRFNPSGPNQITNYVLGGGGGVPESINATATATKPSSAMCTAEMASNSMYAIGWSPNSNSGSYCGQGPAPTLTDAGDVYSYLHVQVTGSEITTWGVNADGGTFDLQHYGGTVTPPTTTTTSTTSTTAGSTTTTTSGSGGTGGVKFVQSWGDSGGVVTLPAKAGPGDLLVASVSLYAGGSNQVTSVTDDAGDTWTKATGTYSTGHMSDGEMWWTDANQAAQPQTVTVHTATTSFATEVQDFSGVAAGPPTSKASAAAPSTAPSTPASVPVAAGSLQVGFVAGHANAEAMTLVPGFTSQSQVQSDGTSSIASLITGYAVSGTSASFGATFPTAMYWASGAAVFSAP